MHPAKVIREEIVHAIRQEAFAIEAAGQLPDRVLDIIYEENWLKLLEPQICGGSEYALPEAVKLFEALAWAEGNVAWCVNLGAGANMFAGYLDLKTAQAIFSDRKTWCAGSGACTGQAFVVAGGYRLSGYWKYASGANHATHFTANAFLLDEQGQQILDKGQPLFRSFLLPAEQVSNKHNWNAIGLKATSSNDFSTEDVFVPEEHTFSLLRPSPFADGALFHFPFEQLAIVNMASMMMGLAFRFIDLYEGIAQKKVHRQSSLLLKDDPAAIKIATATVTAFTEARIQFYQQLDICWQRCGHDKEVPRMLLQQLSYKALQVAGAARNVFSEFYPLFGMNILDPASPENKVWRDAATVSQHYLLSPLNVASR